MHNLTFVSLLFVAFSSFPQYSFSQKSLQLKKTIAISDFEDATTGGQTNVQGPDSSAQSPDGSTGQPVNSKELTDMLMSELVNTNAFNVTEGQQPAEGVQMLVTGSVTKWDTKQKINRGDLIKTWHPNNESSVTVTLKIVDGSDGRILSAQVRSGTIKQKNPFGKKADHTLDSAISQVVRLCVNDIKAEAAKLNWEGTVNSVKDGTIFIQPGSNSGVATGMVFDVYRKGEAIMEDSVIIGYDEKKVGSITVSDVNTGGKFAKATLTSGKGIKKGDIIKPQINSQ